MRRVHELGCRYLQLDDTSLAYINDPAQRARMVAAASDPEHLHEAYIRNLNAALAGRPADLAVTTHMCRGNNRSSWAAEGGYDFVAEALFNELDVDGYFLEYDDERSGAFEPLRHVPPASRWCSAWSRPSGASWSRRTRSAAARRGLEVRRPDQVCISRQCGFSSTVEGNKLSVEEEEAKLGLLVEVAQEVWG